MITTMANKGRRYGHEYKVQAVKLAQETGSAARVASELGISKDMLYRWMKAVREGKLDVGGGTHIPQTALTLNEGLIGLRKQVKPQDKRIRQLEKENAFFEEARAFFAASRLKSQKTSE